MIYFSLDKFQQNKNRNNNNKKIEIKEQTLARRLDMGRD